MTYKKLLENIYYMAYHHKELHNGIMNDLLLEDWHRSKSRGSYDAYAAIVQMIEHYDTMGKTEYKKVFKMKNELPYFLNKEKQRNMKNFREYLDSLKKDVN